MISITWNYLYKQYEILLPQILQLVTKLKGDNIYWYIKTNPLYSAVTPSLRTIFTITSNEDLYALVFSPTPTFNLSML